MSSRHKYELWSEGFAAGTSIHLLDMKMRNGLSVKESGPSDPSISSL